MLTFAEWPFPRKRAGMAAFVAENGIDLLAFRNHLVNRLPAYARPLFPEFRYEIEITGTFKYPKTGLVRQGCDPAFTTDAIYFDNSESQGFVRLDKALHDRIWGGTDSPMSSFDLANPVPRMPSTQQKEWSVLPHECRSAPFAPTSLARVPGSHWDKSLPSFLFILWNGRVGDFGSLDLEEPQKISQTG